MSQSAPLVVSARAIEDIIQIQKINDKLPKVIESQTMKEKLEDIDNSFTKYNSVCPFGENQICLSKVVEDTLKQSEIKVGRRVGFGSEGDYQDKDIHSEEVEIGDKTESELELKSWPSDSDVTVIRMKKEYYNELSTKVSWEEARNLTEESSSVNFDWESHSLINLANITVKEKDNAERLTPFTIWSKTQYHSESYSGPYRNKSLYYSKNFTQTPNNVLYYPPDEMAFYVPVTLQENNANDMIYYKPMREILPVLDEKISMMYRTESLSSVKKKKRKQRTRNNSDFSSGGTKVSQFGKVKLIRSFLNFFGRCGSKKMNLDENN